MNFNQLIEKKTFYKKRLLMDIIMKLWKKNQCHSKYSLHISIKNKRRFYTKNIFNKVIDSSSHYDNQFLFIIIVRLFNNKMNQILNDIKSLIIPSLNPLSINHDCLNEYCPPSDDGSMLSINSIEQPVAANMTSLLKYPEFFYDMGAGNFDADQVRKIFFIKSV